MSYKSAYTPAVRSAANSWLFGEYHQDLLLVVAKMAKEKLPTRSVREALGHGNDAYMAACSELVHDMCADAYDLDIALRYAPEGTPVVKTSETSPAKAVAALMTAALKNRQQFGKYLIHGIVKRLFKDYNYNTYESAANSEYERVYAIRTDANGDPVLKNGKPVRDLVETRTRNISLDALMNPQDDDSKGYDPTRSHDPDAETQTYLARNVSQQEVDLLECCIAKGRKAGIVSYAAMYKVTQNQAQTHLEDTLAILEVISA